MLKIRLLDDRYANFLISSMKIHLPDFIFLINENISNPLSYIDLIRNERPEFILIDNWFYSDN